MKSRIMKRPISSAKTFSVGIISDTHGRLSRSAEAALSGVDHIIHAGDVDRPGILEKIGRLAPVTAVRGNMDHGRWADKLHLFETLSIGGYDIFIRHDPHRMDIDPAEGGFQVVVNGHTHRASIRKDNGVLCVNPGSASFPGIGGTPSLALLTLSPDRVFARIIQLD